MPPMLLDSQQAGLQGARAALRPPEPRRALSAWAALCCAALMALAAIGAASAVVLGGWEPTRGEPPPAEMRAALGA